MATVQYLPIWRGRCCRDWQLAAFARVGRCGYCKQVPEVIGLWGDAA